MIQSVTFEKLSPIWEVSPLKGSRSRFDSPPAELLAYIVIKLAQKSLGMLKIVIIHVPAPVLRPQDARQKSCNLKIQCSLQNQEVKKKRTVDGQNPAPPGMIKTL